MEERILETTDRLFYVAGAAGLLLSAAASGLSFSLPREGETET